MASEAEPETQQNIQRFAWTVVWQIGLLLLGVIGGSFALGLLLDRLTGSRATFLVIALLLSIPLNIATVYLYGRRKMGGQAQTKEVADSD